MSALNKLKTNSVQNLTGRSNRDRVASENGHISDFSRETFFWYFVTLETPTKSRASQLVPVWPHVLHLQCSAYQVLLSVTPYRDLAQISCSTTSNIYILSTTLYLYYKVLIFSIHLKIQFELEFCLYAPISAVIFPLRVCRRSRYTSAGTCWTDISPARSLSSIISACVGLSVEVSSAEFVWSVATVPGEK